MSRNRERLQRYYQERKHFLDTERTGAAVERRLARLQALRDAAYLRYREGNDPVAYDRYHRLCVVSDSIASHLPMLPGAGFRLTSRDSKHRRFA